MEMQIAVWGCRVSARTLLWKGGGRGALVTAIVVPFSWITLTVVVAPSSSVLLTVRCGGANRIRVGVGQSIEVPVGLGTPVRGQTE